ncbi:MAG: hypothetical protein ACXWAT_13105 [Methylobacter sp.]
MARPSKLTEKQWEEIERRMIDGESGCSIAKEFNVSYNGIKKRFGSQIELKKNQIKTVANQVIKAEEAFSELPVSSQLSTLNLINELRETSVHLGGAAKLGAMTARRLAGIANIQANQLSEHSPSEEMLVTIAKLQAVSNEAAKTGLNLLAANKDAAKTSNSAPSGLNHFYGESDT